MRSVKRSYDSILSKRMVTLKEQVFISSPRLLPSASLRLNSINGNVSMPSTVLCFSLSVSRKSCEDDGEGEGGLTTFIGFPAPQKKFFTWNIEFGCR